MINVCMLPATDDYDTNDIMMYAAGVTVRGIAVVPSHSSRTMLWRAKMRKGEVWGKNKTGRNDCDYDVMSGQ